jgi:hypothetical protein
VGVSRLSDAFKVAQVTIGCHIPSTKPSQGLIDVQDEVRGGESMMSLVLCEPTGSSFSTPGFTPGSLPVLLTIPGPPQSHSITLVQEELLIVSTKHRSRSHSIPISTDRRFQTETVPSAQGSPRVRPPPGHTPRRRDQRLAPRGLKLEALVL